MLDFLKTIPDMTNTPEITMTPKIPATKRIRAYKAANPDATAKQVADATGTTVIYVYQVLSNSNKKAKKAKPVAKPKEDNSISKKELDALKEKIKLQDIVIESQRKNIEKRQAIIEYLEGRVSELNELAYG